jgi:hypothetical protein
MIFLVTRGNGLLFTVSAERWFDARKWASAKCPDLTDVTPSTAKTADYEIRWVGRPPNQRMEVRAHGKEWEAA